MLRLRMSLYRTYRPKTFADVTGQEHVVTTLENAVMQGKLAHAYLFAGTRGTGKTSIARILAKAMLTAGVADAALKRHIEEATDDGSLVDCTEIDAASNRGIDDIRSLLEKIQFTPVVASAKVYIIDEVHMLTKEAFNALLKTLEEPPSYAFFILATTELHKIPATIQSRCQRFQFRQIKEEDIVRRLQYIADQEHISVERPALRAIAHHVQGGMRDAISLLDQLRSLPDITLADVQERIGESGHEYVEQLLAAIDTRDVGTIMDLSRTMEERAAPFETVIRILLTAARERLRDAAQSGGDVTAALRMIDSLLNAAKDIRIAPVPALVFESALLSLLSPNSPQPPTPHTHTPPPQAPKPAPTKPKHDEPTPTTPERPPQSTPTPMASVDAATVIAPECTLEAVTAAWPGIVARVEPPFVRMSLKNGQPTAVDGDTITIRFASAFHRDKASSAEGGRSLQEGIEHVFKHPLKLRFVVDAETRITTPSGDVNLAEAALEVF